jgi:alkanesulfonate monooxygenase SsuD/methylene tetrahydromethanopterin reductase-like flavin-dependent oxidoreductase (luciferase family)
VLDEDDTIIKGCAGMYPDRLKTAADWRARAEAKNLSIRDLIIEVTGRQNFIGTAARVAEQLNEYVQADACDGFILVSHLTPAGLDDFVDQVVLQRVTGADELLVTTIAHDHTDRVRSYELLAKEWSP